MVEIIRRDGSVAPAGVAALTAPADYRPSQTFAEPRREPRREPHQPVWIADQSGDAGGVLRRFLKALKRDG